MKVFTYKNYIEAIHTLRLNEIFRVSEKGSKYNIEDAKESKNMLQKVKLTKENAIKLINIVMTQNKKVNAEQLIECKIKKTMGTKKPDAIYKLKQKDTYFVIEYAEAVDEMSTYRMLNYCIDIIYEWNKNIKNKKETRQPKIIPIIVYTGEVKRKTNKKTKEKRISTPIIENYNIDFQFNLIELNKLSKDFLKE